MSSPTPETPEEIVEPQPFHRPDTNICFRISNRMLPPAPPSHVVLTYGDLKKLFRPWHYLLGVPLMVTFVLIVTLEIRLWSGLEASPLLIVGEAIAWLMHTLGWWKAILVVLPLYAGGWMLWLKYQKWAAKKVRHGMSVNSVGILNSMAVLEEQWFREGAENWTRRQRFMSCVSFGFAHMANLFYSVATILPLSLGGYLFMRIYLHEFKKTGSRKDAILAAGLVHRVYNRVALSWAFVAIIYVILQTTLHWPKLL